MNAIKLKPFLLMCIHITEMKLFKRLLLSVTLAFTCSFSAGAAMAPAGYDLSSRVTVSYLYGVESYSLSLPLEPLPTDELINVQVAAIENEPVEGEIGASNQVAAFIISNIGNGNETFLLKVVTGLAGDDFDPVLQAVYLDNGDGIFNPNADELYIPNNNDPTLTMKGTAGSEIHVFVLSLIPEGSQANGLGLFRLNVVPSSVENDGDGDLGVDIVFGYESGEEIVAETAYIATKPNPLLIVSSSAKIFHEDRGFLTIAVSDAELHYTTLVTVSEGDILNDVTLRDPMPDNTKYVLGSMTLNGQPLSDASDADSGEFNASLNEVVVRLGNLSSLDGEQSFFFKAKVN